MEILINNYDLLPIKEKNGELFFNNGEAVLYYDSNDAIVLTDIDGKRVYSLFRDIPCPGCEDPEGYRAKRWDEITTTLKEMGWLL